MKTRFHHFKKHGTIASRARSDGLIDCGIARLAEGDQFSRKLGRTIAKGRLDAGMGKNYHVTTPEIYLAWIKALRRYEASESLSASVNYILALGPNCYHK